MHPNETLLNNLFASLHAHRHNDMADCYDEEATFRDIAFTLRGKTQIHAMWDMICSPDGKGQESDIRATVQELSANDTTGRAVVSEDYTFRDNGRKVQNKIVSMFEFRDGRIVKHTDECDPVDWARQALGGFGGFMAGRFALIRRWKAMNKLKQARPAAF